jgi:hypothetical protein
MASEPPDVSRMSIAEIEQLPINELGAVIRQGHRDLFGTEPSNRDVAEAIAGVRAGHWAPGLPARAGGFDPETIGL